MNLVDFGNKIKQKFSQYKDIDPVELATRTIIKYPTYESMVDPKSRQLIKDMADNLAQAGRDVISNPQMFTPGKLLGGNQAELGTIAAQSMKPGLMRNVVEGINTLPGSVVSGASVGIVDPLKDHQSLTIGGDVGKGVGYLAGMIAPGSLLQRTSKAIAATGPMLQQTSKAIAATGPMTAIHQKLGHQAAKLIAQSGTKKTLDKVVGNVAQGLPYSVAYGLINNAMAPLQEERLPYKPVDLAQDVAIDAALAPIPILGLFGGRNAKNFIDSRQFSALTDKLPRFEIDDSGAKILLEKGQKNFGEMYSSYIERFGENPPLKHVLQHDRLYENYPKLKDTRIILTDETGGYFDPTQGTIHLSKNADKSTLLHEIQHAIQEIEGFARGGSPFQFNSMEEIRGSLFPLKEELSSVKRELEKAMDLGYDKKIIDQLKTKKLNIENEVNKLTKQIENYQGDPEKAYQRLSGELEARAVQRRMDMPVDQRGKIDPYADEARATTGTTNPKDFITRFDGGTQASVDPKNITRQQRTIKAFDESTNKRLVGKIMGNDVVVGDFARNGLERKINKIDRLTENQLLETIEHIQNTYRASSDKNNYRYNNQAHIAKMPDGTYRAIYTRKNSNGQLEVLSWHSISKDPEKYINTLKNNGEVEI